MMQLDRPWSWTCLAGLLTSACWLDGGAESPPRSAQQAAAYVEATLAAQHAGSAVAAAARAGYWEGTLRLGPALVRVSAVSNAQGQVLLREMGGVRAWWLTDLAQQGDDLAGSLRVGGDPRSGRDRVQFFGSSQPGRLDGALRATTWSRADWMADREPTNEEEALAYGHLNLARRTPPAALTVLPVGALASDSATQTELAADANGNLDGRVLGCELTGAIRLSPSVGGVAEIAAQTSGAASCQGIQVVTGSAVAQSDGSLVATLTDGNGAFTLRLPAR
jgi:hypothetical protein